MTACHLSKILGNTLRFGLSLAVVALLAFAAAYGSALYAISNEMFVTRIVSGPWSSVLYVASEDADPYTLAIRSRRGTIPTPVAEAVEFFADTDSAGDALIGTCDYRLIGLMPTSRLWTLAIDVRPSDEIMPPQKPDGYPIQPSYIHSDAVLRRGDNTLDIAIAPTVRPGNWLQLPTSGPFQLATRIYDTPIGEDLSRSPLQFPRIDKVRCR